MSNYATFLYKEKNRLIQTIPKVLAPLALTGVKLTNGSNLVEMTSTANLFPEMAFHCKGVPRGSFISAIIDSTHVELQRSKFDESTGRWSTSGDNAQSSITESGGISAMASGVNHVTVFESLALGVWQNFFAKGTGLSPLNGDINLYGALPTGVSSTDVGLVYAGFDIRPSDEMLAEPKLKRHNAEAWGFWTLVTQYGFVSKVPAGERFSLCLSEITTVS